MQQEFTPKVEEVKIDPTKIKSQYSQMNQAAEQQMQQPQISKEEMQSKIREEEERLDLMLPYYRKQKEALELEIAITTLEVQMGKVAPSTIPGMIGKSLEIQDMESKMQWAHLKLQQQGMLNDLQNKKEELGKEEPKASDVLKNSASLDIDTNSTIGQAVNNIALGEFAPKLEDKPTAE